MDYQSKEKSSKYIGVTKRKNGTYHAKIQFNGTEYYLKISKDEEIYGRTYDKYIVKNNIPGRKLNFQTEHPIYNPNSVTKTFCEKIDKNTVKLLISDDLDICVKIDKEDYVRVKNYVCYISNNCVKIIIGNTTKRLHRFLMNVTSSEIFVDYIDKDPMNNTKKNLRLLDKSIRKKTKTKNASSQYYGVCKNKTRNNWECSIQKNGKKILFERYKNEIDAARKYDIFVLENLKNNNYPLNFTWDSKSEIFMWKKLLNTAKIHSITTDEIFD